MSLNRDTTNLSSLQALIPPVEEFITVHNSFHQEIANICQDNLEQVHVDHIKTLKAMPAYQNYLQAAQRLNLQLTPFAREEINHENIHIIIQKIFLFLKEGYLNKIYDELLCLKKLYEKILTDKNEYQHLPANKEISAIIAKPFQMILRYPMVGEEILKSLKKIKDNFENLNLSTEQMKNIEDTLTFAAETIAQIYAKNQGNSELKNQTPDLPLLQAIKTPSKKKMLSRSMQVKKNTQQHEIIFLNSLFNFFQNLAEQADYQAFQAAFINIYQILYRYSYLSKYSDQKTLELHVLLRPIIVDSFEDHHLKLKQAELKELNAIFDSAATNTKFQNNPPNDYFTSLEKKLVACFMYLIEKTNHPELIKAARAKEFKALTESDSNHLYLFKDLLLEDYSDIQCSLINPPPPNKPIEDFIKGLEPNGIKASDLLAKDNKSSQQISGVIRSSKNLLMTLMRLYHFYLNNAEGQRLCLREEISHNSDARSKNVLHELIKAIIKQQLFFKKPLEPILTLLEKAMDTADDRLKHCLIDINNHYNKVKITQDRSPSIKPMPLHAILKNDYKSELFEDYMQITCLLFCIEEFNLAAHYSDTTNNTKEILQSLCFLPISPERRIARLKETVNDPANNEASFLEMLAKFIAMQASKRENNFRRSSSIKNLSNALANPYRTFSYRRNAYQEIIDILPASQTAENQSNASGEKTHASTKHEILSVRY